MLSSEFYRHVVVQVLFLWQGSTAYITWSPLQQTNYPTTYYDMDVDFEGPVYANKTIRLPDEQRLVSMLFSSYSRDLRPVKHPESPIVVHIGLNLIQIFDLDEKNQVLVANCWVDQEWNDEYIRWDPKQFGNLEVIRIPSNLIWQPDIVLYNNADEYKVNKVISRAMIAHDGNVFMPLPTKIFSSCQIDVTYFPFDEQLCRLKYGSWTYNGWKVDITNRTEGVDMSNYIQNGEWDVIGVYQHRNLVFYSCCVEPYSDVTFYIHLRRKSLYYIMNVFIPSSTMTAMTILVFLLPSDSHQKVNLGITTLLSYSVFTLSVVQKLPETSEYLPLINLYLAGVLSSTSLSILNTVMILSLHYRTMTRLKPIPPRVKHFFFVKIGKIICIREPKHFSAPMSLLKMAETLKSALLVKPPTTAVAAAASGSVHSSPTKSLHGSPSKGPPLVDLIVSSTKTSRAAAATEAFLRNKPPVEKHPKAVHRRTSNLSNSSAVINESSTSSDNAAADFESSSVKSSSSSSAHSKSGSSSSSAEDPFILSELQRAVINSRRNLTASQHIEKIDEDELKQQHELERVVHSLEKIARIHAREQRNEKIMVEWQHLAVIVDRILFLIYMTITCLVTIFLTFGPRNLQPDLSPQLNENRVTTATGAA